MKFLLYVSSIHLLLLKQKYEIFTVDCTQIKDLNNLCVRPTIACKQAKLGLDSLRFALLHFGRDDVKRKNLCFMAFLILSSYFVEFYKKIWYNKKHHEFYTIIIISNKYNSKERISWSVMVFLKIDLSLLV